MSSMSGGASGGSGALWLCWAWALLFCECLAVLCWWLPLLFCACAGCQLLVNVWRSWCGLWWLCAGLWRSCALIWLCCFVLGSAATFSSMSDGLVLGPASAVLVLGLGTCASEGFGCLVAVLVMGANLDSHDNLPSSWLLCLWLLVGSTVVNVWRSLCGVWRCCFVLGSVAAFLSMSGSLGVASGAAVAVLLVGSVPSVRCFCAGHGRLVLGPLLLWALGAVFSVGHGRLCCALCFWWLWALCGGLWLCCSVLGSMAVSVAGCWHLWLLLAAGALCVLCSAAACGCCAHCDVGLSCWRSVLAAGCWLLLLVAGCWQWLAVAAAAAAASSTEDEGR